MLEITKIENGLSWGGRDKFYTSGIFEIGYEIIDTNHISIELDDQVYCLGADSVKIDNQSCTDSSDLVVKIFG
jgi:hypothetical protein